jgi:hypothetical protein
MDVGSQLGICAACRLFLYGINDTDCLISGYRLSYNEYQASMP